MSTLNDDVRKHIGAMLAIIDDRAAINAYLDGIEIAPPKAKNDDGFKNRLLCPKWWRRNLDRQKTRSVEAAQIDQGKVHSRASKYASEYAVIKSAKRASDNRQFIDGQTLISDAEDVVEMADIVAGSVANPNNRRAELMIRMAGFEAYAMQNGYVGEFYTLTCPSKFHRYSQGGFNSAYDDESNPKAAQNYLCAQWAKMRSNFRIDDIRVFGFRVAEPHHDGCPHWHMLLFVRAEKVEILRAIMKEYALEVDGDEPGAEKHRFKAVSIDINKGTATGYIAKYISKNLGFNIEADKTDDNTQTDYGRRVKAWASVWGIRQFQQIGGAPVTVWRELRKISDEQTDTVLESARKAADESRWADFLEIMGGATVSRDDLAVKLKKNEMIDMSTGQLKQNGYGELLVVITGLFTVLSEVRTKLKTWAMVPTKTLAQIGKGAGGVAAAAFTSWSPVNNCA